MKFFPKHFSVRGLLNCEHEPRGGTCWKSADFGAERPNNGIYLFLRGSPGFLLGGSPESPLKCLGAPRGRFSLPRKLILGSIKSGGLLCLRSLPGLICLLRLLCLLRCLSIFCSFVCCDCCAYFLALLTGSFACFAFLACFPNLFRATLSN